MQRRPAHHARPRHARTASALVALCGLAATAQAGWTTWNGPASGWFGDAANWSAGIPGTDSFASVGTSSSFLFIYFDSSPAIDRLDVTDGSVWLHMAGHSLTLLGSDSATPALVIGTDMSASLVVSNGDLSVPSLELGATEGVYSSLNMKTWGGVSATLSTSTLDVGVRGPGSLSLVAGGIAIATDVSLGLEETSAGILAAAGSSAWDVPSQLIASGSMTLGHAGTAKLLVGLDGAIAVAGELACAVEPGSSALISIGGGSKTPAATCSVDIGSTCDLGVAGETTLALMAHGRLAVAGDLTASALTTISFELQSDSDPEWRQLTVDGSASFGDETTGQAAVSIALRSGFEPAIGDSFALASIAGGTDWPTVAVPASTLRRSYEALATSTELALVVHAGAADITGDDLIDMRDLATLLGAWGPATGSAAAADLDGDGAVGAADLALLLGAF